jgi:hypothetical protein
MVGQSGARRWSSRPGRVVRLLPVVPLVFGLVVACGGTATRPDIGVGPAAAAGPTSTVGAENFPG